MKTLAIRSRNKMVLVFWVGAFVLGLLTLQSNALAAQSYIIQDPGKISPFSSTAFNKQLIEAGTIVVIDANKLLPKNQAKISTACKEGPNGYELESRMVDGKEVWHCKNSGISTGVAVKEACTKLNCG